MSNSAKKRARASRWAIERRAKDEEQNRDEDDFFRALGLETLTHYLRGEPEMQPIGVLNVAGKSS